MAKFDAFLKIDGVEGESEDSKHKKEIEVLSFHFGASNASSMGMGGGGGTGKADVHDLSFSFTHGSASPKLFEFCCNGKHIPKAILTNRKAGGDDPLEFLKITLSDVFVTSYNAAGSTGADLPIDQATLSFTKIEHEYKPQTATGTGGGQVKMGWDVKANKKL